MTGPVLVGSLVTATTWKVLHYDETGRPPRPSLHFGKVISVLNGILLGLYYLFYNLKLRPSDPVYG